jgi:hypothetical protein
MSAIGRASHGTTVSHTLLAGAVAGMIAGAVMAMYAMMASAAFLHQGFFTPLYGIASPLTGPDAVNASMRQGVYVAAGPALIGLVAHMMWSAAFGAVFGLIAGATRLSGAGAVALGVVYGLVIMGVMSVVVLPLVGAGSLPGTVGLPSFTMQHLLFGLGLGLWAAIRPGDLLGATPRA